MASAQAVSPPSFGGEGSVLVAMGFGDAHTNGCSNQTLLLYCNHKQVALFVALNLVGYKNIQGDMVASRTYSGVYDLSSIVLERASYRLKFNIDCNPF